MQLRTIADVVHHVADPDCPSCYDEYPGPCQCGGLMHATASLDEDEDGFPMLTTECDRCGRSDEIADRS